MCVRACVGGGLFSGYTAFVLQSILSVIVDTHALFSSRLVINFGA